MLNVLAIIIIIVIIANIIRKDMPKTNYLKLIEFNLRRKGYLDVELARLFILAHKQEEETQTQLEELALLKLEKESKATPPVEGDEPVQPDKANNDEQDKAIADNTDKATAGETEV